MLAYRGNRCGGRCCVSMVRVENKKLTEADESGNYMQGFGQRGKEELMWCGQSFVPLWINELMNKELAILCFSFELITMNLYRQ